MKRIILFLTVCIVSCSDDKFYKDKYDETINITNKSSDSIPQIILWGSSSPVLTNQKVWVFNKIPPNGTESVTFNIKRDMKDASGTIRLMAISNSGDTLKRNFYFTNWQIQEDNAHEVLVYKDKIE